LYDAKWLGSPSDLIKVKLLSNSEIYRNFLGSDKSRSNEKKSATIRTIIQAMSPYGTQRPLNGATLKDQSHLLSQLRFTLPKTGQLILIDRIKSTEDITAVHEIFRQVLHEGRTYPQYGPMDRQQFLDYYCSHDAYCAKLLDSASSSSSAIIVGSVYVKPNFPGRSGHICNGGFLVHHEYRGRGVGGVLADAFELLAKDLGYQAAFFNLVFVSNEPSVRLWRTRGYQEIGTVPQAAYLEGIGLTDAIQFYKKF
jgi:GNAT superfamily N-acetyltransferase